MDGQLVAVGVLVTVAALYVLRSTWKTWAGEKSGCGGGCCSGEKNQEQPALIPPEELTLRRR